MPSFVDLLASTKDKLLWLDYADYAGRLLAGGAPPWLDTSAFVAWQRKAQGLLKSDVIALPLAPLAAAWLKNPALVTAMASSKRAPFPLKTLLADAALRAHIVEMLAGLRASFAKTPLVLAMPSPRHWLALACAQAHGAVHIDTGADETDSAAMYLADFLRAFGECGVDALLLEESPASEPASADEVQWYRPVLNVAAHYRWASGLLLPQAEHDIGAVDFVIAPKCLNGTRSFVALPADFWDGKAHPSDSALRYAKIPGEIAPETVLERLASARRQT